MTKRCNDALSSLAECERRLLYAEEEVEEARAGRGYNDDDDEEGREECLRSKMEAMDEEIDGLRNALEDSEKRARRAENKLLGSGVVDDDDDDDSEEEDRMSTRKRRVNEQQQQDDDDNDDENVGTSYSSPSSKRKRYHEQLSLSPAPPAVMKELTKIRILLAEEERKNRNLQRKYNEQKLQLNDVIAIKEEGLRATDRVTQLEKQAKELRNECELKRVVEEQWKVFAKEMNDALMTMKCNSNLDDSNTANNTPPEVTKVLRQIQSLSQNTSIAQKSQSKCELELESSKRQINTLEQRVLDQSNTMSALQNQNETLQKQLTTSETNSKRAQQYERIAKNEAASMRSLLSTYEMREVASPSGGATKKKDLGIVSPEEGPTVSGLRASLSSTKQELQLAKTQHSEITSKFETLSQEMEQLQTEHERVKDKFGKLRTALMEQREKASNAETRAIAAETHAGKGSFNSDTTKVLHLKHNPMMEAVRTKYEDELSNLNDKLKQKQIELDTLEKALKTATLAAKNSTGSTNSAAAMEQVEASLLASAAKAATQKAEIDAQKYHQRLKESFKEQIGLFREGVYLITGYKVDMFSDSDRPRFKVRSVYAEKEDDHLMFVWPEPITSSHRTSVVSSLDLLDTEFAQAMSNTDNFAYMSKYQSIPAFMGSLTMTLFENQTMMQ
mmetsp:Transcript_24934/g.36599  ORF Transcript_24934/g.36599 Transcript_24934/m.36599 type:complete len:673 (+) Transcript_24934:175-2193(+)